MIRKSIVALLPLTLLAGGCERAPTEHTHAEIDDLRLELEQLTNSVGRLEFRVYELEDHHGDRPATRAPAEYDREQDNGAAAAEANQTEDGRYDLTPVE